MAKESFLLHPNFFESVPLGNSLTAKLLNQRVTETLVDDPSNDPSVSVVIRAFNEAATLALLFEDIDNQLFSSEVEVVVVDNGSTDRTAQVAKHHGAEVVTLPQSSFTYPKSLNVGVEAASNDLVFVTVAHARLTSIHNLHAGARHFSRNTDTAGAFGTCLPNENASYVEKWSTTAINLTMARRPRRIKKAGIGVLAANCAMIAKRAWQELGGFDERYQAGGEDAALAKSMLENGYGVVKEPALAVHHSHGLGLRDSAKQLAHWLQILGPPREFNRQELLKRRPDLRTNTSASRGPTVDHERLLSMQSCQPDNGSSG
jgi:GT2 family glycosyltransferase